MAELATLTEAMAELVHIPPVSLGDGELADTADTVVSVPEILNHWLEAGGIDVGFLGAARHAIEATT